MSYQHPKSIAIGLTGGIASGKSTVAAMFAHQGAAVFNADDAVHFLLENDLPTIEAIAENFPEACRGVLVDRRALGNVVFADREALHRLEDILHPAVRVMGLEFGQRMRRLGKELLVFDIPLLFETEQEGDFDRTVLAECRPALQRARALKRRGMTKDKLDHIMAQQMPLAKKRQIADDVVYTGAGEARSMRRVKRIVKTL